ncbi:MAG: molybdopterin-binding protein [Thermoplasmata archaeon]|jgi:molybdenum cofactor synthesis domain-containing protein|nr:molybdopterin-binding protein [Thermoplasmata archaeon]
MRPIKKLIQLDEAMRIIESKTVAVDETEVLPLVAASDRVCAEDVVSRISVPPFSRAAMDGYAVRARDTFGASKASPVRLTIRERLYAGSVPKKAIGKGECSEIATGAMLPKGADAVVMVEDTETDGKKVSFSESVHPGKNTSKKGEDIAPGAKLVSCGEVLNPSKIGALAAVGIATVSVYRRPRVAIVTTGDEIAELGSTLKPGQVYNINSYTVASAIRSNGGDPRILPIAKDEMGDLERVVDTNSDCDIIVFSGGSSVGERDIMLDLLGRRGEVLFHGIAVKPGKPTLFGTVGDQLLFGMPGYPTSCLSNAYMLLVPTVRSMARLPGREPKSVVARMSKRVVSTTGRTQFLTVRLDGDVAHPAFKESGAITSMAHADGYVMIPADVDLVEKDEQVQVFLL